MSDPLREQLRDYGTFLDEEQGAIDITALQESGAVEQPVRADQQPVPDMSEPWPDSAGDAEQPRSSLWDALFRPRVLAALGSVVAVATAIGLVVILSSADTDPPPMAEGGSEEPTSATSAGGSGQAIAKPEEFPVLEWSRVAHDESVFGGEGEQFMSDVVVGGPGFVAVGWTNPLPGQLTTSEPVVWTSVDGLRWSRVSLGDAAVGSIDYGGMWGVTVGGPGFVAVGFAGNDESGGGAAVWTSADGLSWSLVPFDEAVFGGPGGQLLWSVTVGGPGLVAVGEDKGLDSAAVWTSPDGLSWTRVPHDEPVFGGDDRDEAVFGGSWMDRVTGGGPALVALGSDLWTSVDGRSWTRAPDDPGAVLGSPKRGISDVAVSEDGLIAVGSAGGAAAVWTSPDGVTWSQVESDGRNLGVPGTQMGTVTRVGKGFVAVGNEAATGVAVWTSMDGISWSLVSREEAIFDVDGHTRTGGTAVGAGGLPIVVVGSVENSGSDEFAAAVWTGRIPATERSDD